MTANNKSKVASKFIDSLLLVQNSSTARARDRSADSTAAVARTRREQQLENSTQRESSQFERVEAHLQQRAEQELGQTSARGRNRSRDRDRARGEGRDRELGREDRENEESEESEASTESLFEHQQKASNDEDFYEVFQI